MGDTTRDKDKKMNLKKIPRISLLIEQEFQKKKV